MTFEDAVKASEKAPKKIFVDLYTDWCGWCKRMDQTTFSDSAVVDYMTKNFYSVKFNPEKKDTIRFKGHDFVFIPERRANELALSLTKNELRGYPSSSVLDENFEIIYIQPGYSGPVDFLSKMKFLGDNFYKNETLEDYNKRQNSQ